jgi:hypothetical protein
LRFKVGDLVRYKGLRGVINEVKGDRKYDVILENNTISYLVPEVDLNLISSNYGVVEFIKKHRIGKR